MTQEDNRPNIVFFFTDDQRFDTIAALGNSDIHTPNMDMLVENGLSFTHALIPGGTVGAVCMPSRAMLNTGRGLFQLENSGETIPKNHSLLGETLKQNGYETCGIGKWHNGCSSYGRSFTCGGKIFFGGMADHWNVPVCNFDPDACYEKNTHNFILDPFSNNICRKMICDTIHPGKHSTDLIADEALLNLEKLYSSPSPFYMYISFLAPHDPRSMPEKFLSMYDPDKITLPENFKPEHPFDNGSLRIRDELLAPFPRTGKNTKQQLAEYYAMISHLDFQIGRIIEDLKKAGKYKNTIFILAGDNGLALGQHGLFGKQNCYEHSIRVPLIFAGPGIPRGKKSKAPIYLANIFPTICDILDIPIPENVTMDSFKTVIDNPKENIYNVTYHAYENLQRAVREKSYKLIEYVINGKHTQTQLFDLENDPHETNDISDQPGYAEKLAQMRKTLRALSISSEDIDTKWGKSFWKAIKY